jgi:hypothetical protein
MKGFAFGAGVRRWVSKFAGPAAAILLLAPVPALGFTFLSQWSFNIATINAPVPITSSTDFAGGTSLSVDMGSSSKSTGLGAISFFSAQRDISVGSTGENVSVLRSYQTLMQGATLQSLVYFAPSSGGFVTGNGIDALPNRFNAAGFRFGRSFAVQETPATTVALTPGTYTVFVRLKYKKDRYGIWDNSQAQLGSPHTFTIASAVGP